jgi:hypothetical protein
MTDHASPTDFPYLPQIAITTILQRVANALPRDPRASPEEQADLVKFAVASVFSLRPRDPHEMTLAARIVIMGAITADCLRRATQPGLPEIMRYRIVNQAGALCRLEDSTANKLFERQRHAIAPPGKVQVRLPAARPQAPYVAPGADAVAGDAVAGEAVGVDAVEVDAVGVGEAGAGMALSPRTVASEAQAKPTASVPQPAANAVAQPATASAVQPPSGAAPQTEGRHERRRRERAERRLAAARGTAGVTKLAA